MQMRKKVDEYVERSGIIKEKKELEDLVRKGFKSIVSLESIDLSLQAHAKKIGLKIYNIPIDDYEAPTKREVLKIIAIIEKTKKSGKTLVHCHHGKQRSGIISALYLASKGTHPLQAYHLHDYGMSQRQKKFLLEKGNDFNQLIKKNQKKRSIKRI
jgi:protein tyrosine/serine phosphatase